MAVQKRALSVRLDEDDLHELGIVAAEEGKNVSEVIRDAVSFYLEMRSHHRIPVSLTGDQLSNLQWMVEHGFISGIPEAIDRAVEDFIDLTLKRIEERVERRRRLEEWASAERRIRL